MHYAALVSSSSLSGRPSSSSARLAIKGLARWIEAPVAKADNEAGSCCCRKGKCKETSELLCDDDGHARRHTAVSRAMYLQSQRHLRRIRREFLNTVSHSDVFRTSPSFTMFSRSVASAASVPRRQAASLSSTRAEASDMHPLEARDKKLSHSQSKLQKVWETFSALRTEGDLRAMGLHKLLTFGGTIMEETGADSEVMKDPILWGHRLEHLVLGLRKASSKSYAVESPQVDGLEIVALALQGRSEEAASTLVSFLASSSSARHPRWLLNAFRHVMLSLLRHGSAAQAIDFYLDNNQSLKNKLAKRLPEERLFSRLYTQVFAELTTIFGALDSPASFIATKARLWGKERVSSLGITMIRVLCYDGQAEAAANVYEELRRQNIQVRYFVVHALIRALTKAERYERANILYASIAPNLPDELEARSYDATGLHLFAHQGDVERAEDCFERLLSRGGVQPQEMNLVMLASALQGDTKRVTDLFHEFFGKGIAGSERNHIKPNMYHYSTMINAFAVRDDVAGMNEWLARMLADGCTPDLATYNIVLKGIAQRGDFESINALLNQMRETGVQPNGVSYTTIIKVIARRRDVLGAEALFKRMTREGVPIDRFAVTTLMNAHVEAGSWRGVIRIFDFIDGSQLKDMRLGIEVFNTLLKAYVLIGAPMEVVLRIFNRLERSNIKPTKHTFALLIQSACASGRMDIASKLFVKMENLEKDWTTDIEVTKEVLTIIMAAYLRQGNRGQARVIYEDMQRRGIQPTAYTYASILRSYSDIAFEENTRVAQEFLDLLVSQPSDERTWMEPSSGRENSMAFVYAPLVNAHAKQIDVKAAEQLYQEFLEHSELPTIGILALRMDAYRRAGDIESVERVWPQILDLAVGRTDEVDKLLLTADIESDFFRTRRRGDLLCIPLSIYIDALSQAGRHIEIARTWNRLRELGFQFDAHNWNHLVVALVRAGQVIRAFEVVEKVILPYQDQSYRIIRDRVDKVDSPIVFDDKETQAEIEDEPFLARIERSHLRRPSLLERLRRRFSGEGRKESENLAHELHLMQQISPEWNVWRPHDVTLQILARALEKLHSGRVIRPTPPLASLQSKEEGDPDIENEGQGEEVQEVVDEEQEDEDETEEIDDVEEYNHQPPTEEEVKEARKTLNHILQTYPRTITKVDLWERESAQKASQQSERFVRQSRRELQDL